MQFLKKSSNNKKLVDFQKSTNNYKNSPKFKKSIKINVKAKTMYLKK